MSAATLAVMWLAVPAAARLAAVSRVSRLAVRGLPSPRTASGQTDRGGVAVCARLGADLSSPAAAGRVYSAFVSDGGRGCRSAAAGVDTYKPRVLSEGGARLKLSPREEKLFDFLREAVGAADCRTVMRVAGGWVRDKLLGLETDDIDLAIDNMTGLSFAHVLRARLQALGTPLPIGVIQANPDQSKHLETVAISLHGFSIDLVNLRSEEYSCESRIPSEVRFGSPLSDAQRRDLTINSLFYNLNTDSLEDFTGRGLADLEARVIDTPMAPQATLYDDPLRCLRSIRFAARLDYAIAPSLWEAMADTRVQAQLGAKISRERVLRELYSMVGAAGAAPIRAFRLIAQLRLHEAIFLADMRGTAAAADGGGAVARAARTHEAARALRSGTSRLEVLHALLCESRSICADGRDAAAEVAAQARAERGPDADLEALSSLMRTLHGDKRGRRRLWVATVLLPLAQAEAARPAEQCASGRSVPQPVHGPDGPGAGRRNRKLAPEPSGKQLSVVEAVMRRGLKGMTSADIHAVQRLHAHAADLRALAETLAHDAALPSRRRVGLAIRRAGELWPSCLQLALVEALPSLPIQPTSAQVREWRSDSATTSTLRAYGALAQVVADYSLQDAWALPPLIDGNKIIAMGVPKGRAVGIAMAALIEWQLENPAGTVEDACLWMAQRVQDQR